MKNTIKHKLLALCFFFFIVSLFAQKQNAIYPGQVWLDTNGKPIQAHGFSVFYKDGTYYWYGENKEFTKSGSNIWTYGIRCYTSQDFYNWEDKGLIIPPDTVNVLSPLHPSQQYDRPHIIFCAKTQKYVAWIKVMGASQSMTILEADKFMGPYKIVRQGYKPNGFESGDFDLYVDEESGKGYLWAERPHYEMICSTLSDDFTSVISEYSNHFVGILPPDTREAPVHFIRKGKHYMFTSGTTSYYANPSLVSTFDDYHGEYTDLGNPHPEDSTNTSYCSQITDVIKIPGKKDLYIAVADRWMPKSCGSDLFKRLSTIMRDMFKDSKPQERNFDQVAMVDKTTEKRTALDATKNARYVWLPIVWENDVPRIYWKDEWKLEDFE
ncbi:family 43 glycosylhydrolase [Dysgonomonas capnocytophagoides]|uniref:family 43 glycosylhydrolase n=1 Tax=Dysgonomonas capnocytophagoides TaxID=45254 RepID=UPI00333E650F